MELLFRKKRMENTAKAIYLAHSFYGKERRPTNKNGTAANRPPENHMNFITYAPIDFVESPSSLKAIRLKDRTAWN